MTNLLQWLLVCGCCILGGSCCESGWIAHGASCYKYIGQPGVTWANAQDGCKGAGAKLVEITSQEENDFIRGLVQQHGEGVGAWLGVTDRQKEGQYVLASSNSPAHFLPWGPNEPHDDGGEDCVAMELKRYQGRWDDQLCDELHVFICQRVEGAGTVDCPAGWDSHGPSCYKFMGQADSWYTAQTKCESVALNSKLVEIDNQEENNFIIKFVQNHGGQGAWLGVTDLQHEGQYLLTSSSVPASYLPWGTNEPHDGGGEDCVAMDIARYHGHWDDQRCDVLHASVCQVVGPVQFSTTPGTTPDYRSLPFMDPALPRSQRVQDLVSRLTLDEVAQQLRTLAPAIDRLGIRSYQWRPDCGGGGGSQNATVFPQNIGLAAAFSPDLWYRLAEARAEEQRAIHNHVSSQGHAGSLSCLVPNLDILIHPLWGRNQEAIGEDPYLARLLAHYFIHGMQGDHPRYLRVSAGCAHFALHSGPEHSGGADAKASMTDMRMTYLPGFRQCVSSGASSFVTGDNDINGVAAAANHWLLTELTRQDWNFTGYVMAEPGSLEHVQSQSSPNSDPANTAATALKAGVNLEDSSSGQNGYFSNITQAVQQGLITENAVRERLKPLMDTRMRLGEFDPPNTNPYSQVNSSVVGSLEHQQLAVEAAMKSFVLLKNDGVLPLNQTLYTSVALMGPFGDDVVNIYGSIPTTNSNSGRGSVLAAMKRMFGVVHEVAGCGNGAQCSGFGSQQVSSAAQTADLIVLALGTGASLEGPGRDRHHYDLPGHQKQLVMEVLDNAGSAPVVMLLFTGAAIDISFAEFDPRVSAIMQCFFPAQATGDALRHVLLNDVKGAAPAARLPFTWYKVESDLGSTSDYSLAGRTYRYLGTGVQPLYPFGFGLSYTSFTYSALTLDARAVTAGSDLTGVVTVRNTGSWDADEVVQVYISWQRAGLPAPRLQLAWFDRVSVPRAGQASVYFTVEAKTMALWISDQWEIPEGPMKLYVGGQQPNQAKSLPSNILTEDWSIQGTQHPVDLVG